MGCAEGISVTDREKVFRVWLSIGIAMLLAGSFFTAQTAVFLRTAKHAQGTIVSRDPNWGSCRFLVTVEFNGGGRTVRVPECVHVYAFRFPLGQRVPVLYNPQRPDHAMIDSFWRVWSIWGLFLPLGLLLCIGAFIARRP
jgi:Protein of unknown function (DUF3592)